MARFFGGCSATCFFTAALCFAPAARAEQDPSFWQNQNIYQVITDRFFDGDASNNNADGNYNPAGSSGTSVHGGDFKGLEQKLDYIKSLGATAIWISPIVLNANGEFHGYAGRNFYQVDPHWGTLADLKHFVDAAHARGLLVIDDIIVNHGGDLINSSDSGYGTFRAPPAGYNLRFRNSSKIYPPPFDLNATNTALTNLFHNHGEIQNYSDDAQVVLGELSGLDDFKTESDYVRDRMTEIYNYWIGQVGFDGFRIDTVKHVEMGFWQTWCPAVHAYAATNGLPNFFLFGEVYDGSDAKCGSYTGTQGGGAFKMDSVVDYPLYWILNSVFATASGNTAQIENRYAALTANYDPVARDRLVTFLDNHDQARFLSSGLANNNTNRLKLATAFLYTARGLPCLYYGTEQAFNGATDPYDREDMFAGQFEQGPSLGDNFNLTHPMFQWIARLNNFRRLYPALRTGIHSNMWYNASAPGLFAYARRLNTQEVFVVLNTANSAQTLPARPTMYPAGTTLVNLLDTNETVTVATGPQIPSVSVPATTAKLFLARDQWLPLDPVVTSTSPAHDASGISAGAPIILQFSQPMDTGTVVSAFSTLPALSGTFSWSPALDRLTFTPGGAGFPTQSLVTVRLAATARAANGGSNFAAAFESRFKTGTSSFVDLIAPTLSIVSPTNGAELSGNTLLTGTAGDNLALQLVEVRLDTNAWIAASGTASWSLLLNTSNLLNGSHTLFARATDTSGNVSETNSVAVRFVNVPGAYLQRLSGGNPSNVVDCAGNIWLRDQPYTLGSCGYSGGTTGYLANTITGICASAQTLYQRERYSTSASGFRYWFDCPAGLYEITLLETDTWVTGAGQRLFQVFIEDQQVLTNFDIFAAAGGKNLPVTRAFTNRVSDGQLEVLFVPTADNARCSGIQVRKLGDLFSGNDSLPDWWRLAYFDHPADLAADLSRASDDADGDGATNLAEFLAGTDPRDPASVFQITALSQEGALAQVSWRTRLGKTYQLQQSDRPYPSALWTNLGSPLPGTDRVITQTVQAPSGPCGFYRVEAY